MTLRTTTDKSTGVALLTLDRPEQLNAFDLTMARELQEFFLTDARDDAIRAVVERTGMPRRTVYDAVVANKAP